MPKLAKSSRPIAGSQLLQDTFENLSDQGKNVTQGLKNLVSGHPKPKAQLPTPAGPGSKDSGIEQLSGAKPSDPAKQPPPAQPPGLTPQQLAEKKAEEEKQAQFHRQQVKQWEEDYQRMKQEDEAKKEKETEEEKAKQDQEIVQLQEEEAKAAVLQPPAKPKKGRGTAFLPRKAKQRMGTGEIGKRPTQ